MLVKSAEELIELCFVRLSVSEQEMLRVKVIAFHSTVFQPAVARAPTIYVFVGVITIISFVK